MPMAQATEHVKPSSSTAVDTTKKIKKSRRKMPANFTAEDLALLRKWELDVSQKSDRTARSYSTHIIQFCKATGLSLTEIVKLESNPKAAKVIVSDWVDEMRERADKYGGKFTIERKGKLSKNTIPVIVSGVKSFFDYCEVPVIWKRFMRIKRAANKLRAYRRDQIIALLEHADPRGRVCILVMVSGGIRIGGLVSLKIGDIERIPADATPLGLEFAIIRIYSGDEADNYATLITPEALRAIDLYIEYRKAHGETITDDSPLVRNKFAHPRKAGNTKHTLNRSKHVTEENIRAGMKKLLAKANIDDIYLQPNHSFRKFFNTMAKLAGVDLMYKEVFMGHSIRLDEVYFDLEIPEAKNRVLQEYIKAVPRLTMSETFELKEQVAVLTEKAKGAERVEALEAMVRQQQIAQEIKDKKRDEDMAELKKMLSLGREKALP